MLVLGIETSCDETGLALVSDGRTIVGSQLASSLQYHQHYGGVVPEIASRAHVELLTYELEQLLTLCGVSFKAVDRIAVTHGPGLPGSLLVGVAAAKALALVWKKPIVAVNHLHAHLYAAIMEADGWPLDAPQIGLVISGGHTAIVKMEGIHRFHLLGQTHDDAVGEAFDKVARLLGLGFPGGPEIERVAQSGNPKAFRFSVPRIKQGSPYDFSFSGIKTAVLHVVKRYSLSENLTADLAASFQHAVVEEVVEKTVAACRWHRVDRLVLGGGVVANRLLRERFQEVCHGEKIRLAFPSSRLCTDNGVMVAGLGYHICETDPSRLTAVPDLKVGEVR
jgi:N6-L-threonylcarbamoyladenine synthase